MTTLIDRTQLQALLAAGTVTLVDALPQSYYDQHHLPGAVNLVADDVTSRAAALLPDRSATIVTYCSNLAPRAGRRRIERPGHRASTMICKALTLRRAGSAPRQDGQVQADRSSL